MGHFSTLLCIFFSRFSVRILILLKASLNHLIKFLESMLWLHVQSKFKLYPDQGCHQWIMSGKMVFLSDWKDNFLRSSLHILHSENSGKILVSLVCWRPCAHFFIESLTLKTSNRADFDHTQFFFCILLLTECFGAGFLTLKMSIFPSGFLSPKVFKLELSCNCYWYTPRFSLSWPIWWMHPKLAHGRLQQLLRW